MVVDPRFTRTAAVADQFAQLRPGTDIAFLGGVIRYLLENGRHPGASTSPPTPTPRSCCAPTSASTTGSSPATTRPSAATTSATWAYQLDQDGYARVDPTLQDPHCVYQAMKRHYARYTPELVARRVRRAGRRVPGDLQDHRLHRAPNRTMTSLYALGWTQHTVGSQNIRAIACIQLLLGNMGMPGGGVNALRGHSNIQGLTDLGVMSHLLPGYLGLPTEQERDLKTYLEKRTPRPLRPGQMNYWQNYPKFFVSLLKAWFGAEATKENDFRFDWLPKNDKTYDILAAFELMHQGRSTGTSARASTRWPRSPTRAS